MSRPEVIADIELEDIEIATFKLEKFATDGKILKGYTAFIEAMNSAGHIVDSTTYQGVIVYRRPNLKEQVEQLKVAQGSWDTGKKYYDQKASVGECEYSYYESTAKSWAEKEGLPWPPECEPIATVDTVIRDIEALAETS